MAKRGGKNPYYHPDPEHGMLNQIGEMDSKGNIIDDGYSFDEYDDDDDEIGAPVEKTADERTPDGRRLYELNGEKYSFRVGGYVTDPMVMSISMECEDGEPYGTLSKNFGSFVGNDPYTGSFIRENCTFIDTNNYKGIESFLQEIGAQPYKKWGSTVTVQSGFCEYPLYEFPHDVLKDMDPKGYEKHMADYREEFPKEQRKLQAATFGLEEPDDEFE